MFEKISSRLKKKNNKGYVVITTVLILLVVSVTIASTLALLSSGNAQISFSRVKGEQALAWSGSCLEEALLKIKTDALYAGGNVDFPQGTCHINVENLDGVYTIKVSFEGSEEYSRAIESKAEFADGKLKVISWEQKSFVIN